MTTGCRGGATFEMLRVAWVVGGLALGTSAALGEQGAVREVGSSEFPREVVLRREAVPYQLESTTRNLEKRTEPFLKEPELSGGRVFRQVLRLGKDTNNAIGLIWDQPRHKLYLDLNRNLDLTDDPAGVFSSTNKGPQHLFGEVTLPAKTATGFELVTVNLHLSAQGDGSRVQAQLISRSLWQAKVEVGGEAWQVAVADDLSGPEGPAAAKFLALRPWAARTNRVYLRSPRNGTVPLPERLFWVGRAFRLERQFDTSAGGAVCKLEFKPEQPPLAELKLAGKHVYCAMLQDTNGYLAVLYRPSGTLKVPRGSYSVSAAWLKEGAAEAYWTSQKPLVVEAQTVANLVLGGPLTNWVTVERQGRSLLLAHRLKGAGGEPYRLAKEDQDKPPEFVVYRGGKKVLADKFRYG